MDGPPVKFHATRLQAGPNPDSIIMSSAPADMVLKESAVRPLVGRFGAAPVAKAVWICR